VEVEDDHLGPKPVEGGQAGLAAQLPGDFVAELLEIVADAAQHIDVVIDEEDRYGHRVTLNAVRGRSGHGPLRYAQGDTPVLPTRN
jgi:hypothetical protein